MRCPARTSPSARDSRSGRTSRAEGAPRSDFNRPARRRTVRVGTSRRSPMHKAVIIGVGPDRGLGAQLCKRFAKEGLHVVAAGRTPASLDAVVADIVKPGTVENGIFSGLDWYPTFVPAAGNPHITEHLLTG